MSPRLFGGSLQGDALVCAICLLTPAVVVIHEMTAFRGYVEMIVLLVVDDRLQTSDHYTIS